MEHPLNYKRVKELDAIMLKFGVETVTFIEQEGMLSGDVIREAWLDVYAEFLARKTNS